MGENIKAVAFDLDGTFYPNYRLYARLIPFIFRHPHFFTAFNKVRHHLHRPDWTGSGADFYDEQAALMAHILKQDPLKLKLDIDRLIYRGWEKLFAGIKPFPYVKETLLAFRQEGLKLAVLSDFPPNQKIALLGLDGLFDILLSTEETGRLKPSPLPFTKLSEALSLKPQELLFVGNSYRYDVVGARLAGMKTALIKKSPLSTGASRTTEGTDFVFRNYRQLKEFVLNLTDK